MAAPSSQSCQGRNTIRYGQGVPPTDPWISIRAFLLHTVCLTVNPKGQGPCCLVHPVPRTMPGILRPLNKHFLDGWMSGWMDG